MKMAGAGSFWELAPAALSDLGGGPAPSFLFFESFGAFISSACNNKIGAGGSGAWKDKQNVYAEEKSEDKVFVVDGVGIYCRSLFGFGYFDWENIPTSFIVSNCF